MQGRRRKKRRTAVGTRTVRLARGASGFGFTICGQRPCVVSRVAARSPAEAAGLRPGHLLVSVDGVDARRLPHEAVVGLVDGASELRLTLGRRDSSDSDEDEYRCVVGYLGSISLPERPAKSDCKLHSVRACIRRVRQEKRPPLAVVMRVGPRATCLHAPSSPRPLASYPAERIARASRGSDADGRFFGLVTAGGRDSQPSCCHVFCADPPLAERVVSAVRSAYELPEDDGDFARVEQRQAPPTPTDSNSDSGIGFHNDCADVSDRILVVDFPPPKPDHVFLHPAAVLFDRRRRPLEGANSEPDLRDRLQTEGDSPLNRWTGGGSGRLPKHRSHLRPSSGLIRSEQNMYTKCEAQAKPEEHKENRVTSWALSLEKLLSDPAGVHALSAFLEREFSAENIRFWTSCERWVKSPPETRQSLAISLHKKYLADGASDLVNVDAEARHLCEKKLDEAPLDLFSQVQKQIFNLMKFDSYPRFIKSDIYKECLMAELQGRSQPYPGDPELAVEPEKSGQTKLKKSLSNAEDRRRKSLLSWNIKLRSKSRDRCFDDENDDKSQSLVKDNELKGSNSSLLSGWDVTRGLNHKQCSSSGCGSTVGLCRVMVPGLAATSVVEAGGDETVRQLLDRLLEKRAVRFLAYEVYAVDCNKPIDINQNSSVLAGKEVSVEQRVLFKLDLPNKVVTVKAKPNKTLADVLKPVLHKYGLSGCEGLSVVMENRLLKLNQLVQDVDGQRLQVCFSQNNEMPQQHHKNFNPVSLDEITNRVFEELLQGKAEKIHSNIEEGSIRSDNCSSEHSSGIFGRFRRQDEHRAKGSKGKKQIPLAHQALTRSVPLSASSEGSSCCAEDSGCNRRPLIAKLKDGDRIQNAEFLENLKQIQRARLKDSSDNEESAAPCPAPRLSLAQEKSDDGERWSESQKRPPPLPPKPKVVPIKPSNWGHGLLPPDDLLHSKRTVYLDRPAGSIV